MITLPQARSHLRIDGTQDDAEIQLKLTMARALVDLYIGNLPEPVYEARTAEDGTTYYAENAESTHRREHEGALDAAVLLALGDLWLNRESTTGDPLSPRVRNILQFFRTLAYA